MELGSFSEQVPERRSQLPGKMDDTQLSPEWLQKTSALVEGGLNSGWRPGATGDTAVPKIPSRFDTTSGPARWKDEGNARRLDGGAGSAGERWTEVGPGGSHLAQAFPTDLFSSGDRWTAPDPNAGRGRGRGMVGLQDPSAAAGATWKSGAGAAAGAPQPAGGGGPEWRGAGSEVNPRNEWRNDRWNAAPGSRNQDTWRGAGPGAAAGRGGGGQMGFVGSSGAPGGGLGAGAGISGGFSIGRGSGTFTRSDSVSSGANGAGRGGALGASGRSPSSSFFRSFGPGGGVGGSLAWGPSKAQHRYTTDQLAFVYRQLLYAGRLKLPHSVERDDPLLFVADGDFVDVVEQFSGVDPRISAEVYLEHQALMQRVHSRGFLPSGGSLGGELGAIGGGGASGMAMSPPRQGQLQGLPEEHRVHQMQPHSAFIDPSPPHHQQQQQQQQQLLPQQQPQPQQQMGVSDPGWVYRDPQGMLQGPFPKQDIIEWFEGGFFPLELQLRPATDPLDAPFYPLSDLLQVWRGPAAAMMGGQTGFVPQQQPQQQQHGFVGGMGVPQEFLKQQQGNPAFMGQQPQQGAGGLPDDLMLSGHLQHLSIGGLGVPQQQQQQLQQQHLADKAFAPAPFDPIVDPALVKRSASQNMLGQQQDAIGGGLLGSRQQQQQQQESRQPAWTAAAAAHPVAAGAQDASGLSLAAIQKEDQRRMREEEEQRRQQQQAVVGGAGSAPPPPPPPPLQGPAPGYEMEPPSPQRQRPETKVAPWVTAVPTPESAGKTLLEIQAEEAERQAQLEAQLAQQAAANRLAAGPPGGGWARVARGTTASGPSSGPSLMEIQQAEERAKAAAAAGGGGGGGGEDDGLFWEYDKASSGTAADGSVGVGNSSVVMPPPPPAPKAKVGGWAAAASKAPVAVSMATKPNGAVGRPATIAVVRPPPPPPPRAASSSAMPAFIPPSDEDMAAIAAAAGGGGVAGVTDGSGSSALCGPFRSWCVEQMQELTNSSDVTLCEFLMTVESNSEVAEYVSTYLGATPTAAKFTAEFLKRKLAEQASTGKKSRKARAKANAVAAALANGGASAAAGGKAQSGPAGAGDESDTSWAHVSDVGAKKTKKKGQKVDSMMLGFASGTNYSLLDVPE